MAMGAADWSSGRVVESQSDGDDDADRLVDRAAFRKDQFDQFKHRFRQSAVEGETAAAQAGFDAGFDGAFPLSLRLGSALGGLDALIHREKLPKTGDVTQLRADLFALLQKMHRFKLTAEAEASAEEEEFSPESLADRLPQFDAVDMQLLLGESTVQAESVNAQVADSFAASNDSLDGLRAEADGLLRRFSAVIHAAGFCDSFVFGGP